MARAPRLAFVSDAVAPWNTGGKEARHHELLTRLAAAGVHVEVYTMMWWGDWKRDPRRLERDGLTYVAICPRLPLYSGDRRSIRQALLFALATFRLVTARFDVAEVDSIPFLPLFPMRVVTWVRRRRMVVTWHEYWGPAYWRDYLGLRGRLASAVENLALRLPDRIVAASEGTGERLRAVGPRGLDVHVVPNGVRVHAVGEPPAHLQPVPPLVAAGRLLRHKQMHQALDAVALLRERGRPTGLLVIGEGPERVALERQAADLGLGDLVRFSDFLPDQGDVLDTVAAAQVLVFPSVREGFGMMALEALSVGTPVVTSDHPDNVGRFLVAPGVDGAWCDQTPASLADAIELCLARHDEMGRAAVRAADAYDWDVLAAQVADAYGLGPLAVPGAPVSSPRPEREPLA